jgi:hypothetical protein
MGCGASAERAPERDSGPEDASTSAAPASQGVAHTDKVQFKQATVIDLLSSEREHNERVLLKWASAVFTRLKDDENRAVCLSMSSASDISMSDHSISRNFLTCYTQ